MNVPYYFFEIIEEKYQPKKHRKNETLLKTVSKNSMNNKKTAIYLASLYFLSILFVIVT
jgi:hypothetical protein